MVASSTAHRVIEWLKGLGHQVPRDIGLAVAAVPYGDRTIAGVDENVPLIGAQAVEAVVGMIQRNEQGVPEHPFSLLVEGVWTPGRTVRVVRPARQKRPARSVCPEASAPKPAASRRRRAKPV